MNFFKNNFDKEKNQEYSGISKEDRPKIYNDISRIDIVNYFSLDCPQCRSAFIKEEESKDRYRNINVYYRQNPLDIQPLSGDKAIIAECIFSENGNGKYYEFILDSFTNYVDSKNNDWILGLAKKYMKDPVSFNSCLHSDKAKANVTNQKIKNIGDGIAYTPTLLIFINHSFVKKFENLSAAQVISIINYYNDLKL